MCLCSAWACVSAEQVFIIGVEDNHYLPHYAYSDGEYQGFGRAILDAFFTAQGYQHRYRALPVTRLFQSFVDQALDFKYPDNPLWWPELKKGKNIVYSNPVIASTDGVNVLPQRHGRGLAAIKRLATVRGFMAPGWQDLLASKQVALIEGASLNRLLHQVLIGRVDGVYANIDVVQYALRHQLNQPQALLFDASLPHTKSHYYLSSLKYPDLISEFNAWMQQHVELIQRLRVEFGIEPTPD